MDYEWRHFHHLASTHFYSLGLPADELFARKPWVLVDADIQTAGSGTYGRDWDSAEPRNIYATLNYCWKSPREKIQEKFLLQTLPQVVSLFLAETLQKNFLLPVKLKWVNDLVIERNGKLAKVGGILCHFRPPYHLIMSFGINVVPPQNIQNISQCVTGLTEDASAKWTKKEILPRLTSVLVENIPDFLSGKVTFQDLLPRIQQQNPMLGTWQVVRDRITGMQIQGKVSGISSDGELELCLSSGEHVTVRCGSFEK